MTAGWTPARTAEAKRLWLEGATADAIATALRGSGISRAAVCGKIFRLGLGRGGNARRGTGHAKNVHVKGTATERVARPAVHPPHAQRPAIVAPPPLPRVEPVRINGRGCRWPLGDPHAPGFLFCDADLVRGRPYCEPHCRRAGMKSGERPLQVVGRVARPYEFGRADL